jgi:hypothetical protein
VAKLERLLFREQEMREFNSHPSDHLLVMRKRPRSIVTVQGACTSPTSV